MNIDHPSKALSDALGAAIHRDLSPIPYRRWTPAMKKDGVARDDAPLEHRRPSSWEVEVVMFPETWGSTALGYGGVGGSAMTPAYTIIVSCDQVAEACIYWGGSRLGAKLDLTDRRQNEALREAMRIQSTHDISKEGRARMKERMK